MILSELPPAAQRDFARFTDCGWKAKIIMDLLNRRYDLRLNCDQIRRMQLLACPKHKKAPGRWPGHDINKKGRPDASNPPRYAP